MTRINLISPADLTDQHLMAEYRELPRIFGLAHKHYLAGKKLEVKGPYKLGSGHVVFFYDKIKFLEKRQASIIEELLKRRVNIQNVTVSIPTLPAHYLNDWIASQEEVFESIARLQEKLDMKPAFYKLRKLPVNRNHYADLL